MTALDRVKVGWTEICRLAIESIDPSVGNQFLDKSSHIYKSGCRSVGNQFCNQFCNQFLSEMKDFLHKNN